MKELVNRAKRGDPDAFASLMQSQMQTMYKTARSILSQDADAADAISDTILSCWEHLGSLQNEEYFRARMMRILVNQCYAQIRKNKRTVPEEVLPDQGYRDPGFENIEWKETLDSLPEKYRLVMVLYYVEGFPVSQISQILRMPEGTVKSKLARGRRYLTEAFEDGERRSEG